MEKGQNPSSHKRLRLDTPNSWSGLPQDLLISVLERLGFADFQRAKSVCRSWFSASRQVVAKNHIHWLIIFPRDKKTNPCMLYNPEEKDKLYETQDLGVEFAMSCCWETHGSWLLMSDRCNLYILNLFSHERINLPPADLLWDEYELHNKREMDIRRYKRGLARNMRSAVFWIDEKTKDYVVVWGLMGWCVFYSKKGDTSWNQIPQTSDCFDMVYKDHKLYFLSETEGFKIFDFSGANPQETFQSIFKLAKTNQYAPSNQWNVHDTKLVVTVTGKVLKVEKMWRASTRTTSFRVFEVYSSDFMKKTKRRIHSLGEESMLLDKGITVLANDTDGFIRNSIYFSGCDGRHTKDMLIFNLETRKIETMHTCDRSSFPYGSYRSKWFIPSCMH
ncbi:PREDICTED: putative F-box protein At4g22170 [Camelina sativa]|uniref:F-box protein At4g22170 n=1 Tax=Camelina sativa TaxID=90675 RepID=A0ABM0URW4_CAMSA|nr:PREDICTED: putative F-box protein At4g22170 [Camelina sativa]